MAYDAPDMSRRVRVFQRWPRGLKAAVESVAGERGMTEFTIDAVTDALYELGVEVPDLPVEDDEEYQVA